ncbi:MAG: autotransporter-associated beta strand repeat-containing protein, partial [Candidatus Accumulibacter sp.]|nr:autotransporter-associated beta strand repeat-containing protein [Accumulibacter sp.]
MALAALALSMPVMAASFTIDSTGSNVTNNTACLKNSTLTTDCSSGPTQDPLNPDGETTKAIIPGGVPPSASYNKVTITGWTGSSPIPSTGYSVAGGYYPSAFVTRNTVKIDGASDITGNVYGGYGADADVNEVTIDSSTITGYIYGGYGNNNGFTASNTVTISKTSVTGNVYGGYSVPGDATGNTVTIGEASCIKGNVYGGDGSNSTKDFFTGNKLVKNGADSIIAGTASNFQKLEFNYGDSGKANIHELNTTETEGRVVEINVKNHNVTFDGNITGRGGLNKTGDGTLTLTAANIYEGGTTITGGLIEFDRPENFGGTD